MKILFYIMLLATAANCGTSEQTEIATTQKEPQLQEEQTGVLIGEIQREDLQQPPFSSWFDPMFKSYQPNEEALQTIKENINDYEIKMFMGTWCGDSQREVPKFYKLLELSNYDLSKLDVYAVSHNKTLPNEAEKEFDIKYVPTIIFLKNGKEVGRFVEHPREELEEDIAKIVSGQEYKHSYE